LGVLIVFHHVVELAEPSAHAHIRQAVGLSEIVEQFELGLVLLLFVLADVQPA
jgi:hypothetical protein